MGMTIEDYTKMLIAKEKCMERDTSGTDTECNSFNCDDCSLCYEQGTMGEQKEALKFAVETMRKYQKIQEIMNELNGDFYGSYLKDRQTLEKIYEVIEDGRNKRL